MRYDLYINDQLCDLDDNSLIVLNYTMEQLTNPTAVKNTYSHEVQLPCTERNNIVFSHFYRNDYLIGPATFSPLRQLPFAIYNELGEIAERGYIKLSEVQLDKTTHTYKVTLYGGLGSFFYAMGYAESGEALKLSELQYFGEDSGFSDSLLNIRINRNTIVTAWKTINEGTNNLSIRAPFEVVNFAPTYQGRPDGDFDSKKALFIGRATMSNGSYTDTLRNPIYGISSVNGANKMYKRFNEDGTDSGYRMLLVELAEECSEWETKDLRTYLQRPILSVRKFFEAVQRRATEYGYTLNLDSAFFNANNPYYNDTWLTLTSLQGVVNNKIDYKSEDVRLTANMQISGVEFQSFPISIESLSPGDGYEYDATLQNLKFAPKLQIYTTSYSKDDIFKLSALYEKKGILPKPTRTSVAWFMQLSYNLANEEDGIRGSKVIILVDYSETASGAEIASMAGFTPIGANIEYVVVHGEFHRKGRSNAHVFNQYVEFFIENLGSSVEDLTLNITKKIYRQGTSELAINQVAGYFKREGYWVPTPYYGYPEIVSGTAEQTTTQNTRNGAIVSKDTLLNIGVSPLQLLLSYSKMFGLVWLYDKDYNVVNLMQRDTFYNGGELIDWSSRIDESQKTIKPFEFDKRFYDFELKYSGQWAKEYREKYGSEYGRQRVETGYNFDQDAKNLLQDSSIKGVAEVLQRSKYFTNITEGTYILGSQSYPKICPSVFLSGGKYTLYDTLGNPTTYDITPPTRNADIEYFNELQGYDYLSKVQMHEDNTLVGEGCALLLYDKSITITADSPYKQFRLTDDVAEMGELNDGVPCWVLEGSSYGSLVNNTIPHFVRASGVSLDMGVPQELDNPDADTEAVQKSIYSQYWQKYLSDRYDQNSRVLTCYVDLRGLQVSNALFRNFYYFDNAVWVLNRIINYSMTTVGTTQCEFVKVQDVNNYKG